MTKKSQRHPLRYDKDQAGCIWGFISFFDFRHRRLTRRLLSDRSRFTRQVVAAGCSTPPQFIPTNSYRNPQEIHDGEKRDDMIADTSTTSVKELMEEDMFVEKDCKDQITNGDIKTRESVLEHKERVKKKRRRKKKASKSLGDLQSESNVSQKSDAQCSFQQNSEDTTSRKVDLEIVANDICQQIYQKSTSVVKDDSNNEIDLLVEQNNHVADKKLSEAIRLFVDRRYKDGKVDHSKEFMDALETLSSNKELILELLKDPNSVLVKHIEKLEASNQEKTQNENSVDKSNLLDGELSSVKRRHSFFRRKSKSEEKIKLNGDDNCQTPNRIVILKPGLPFQSPDILGNGVRNERIGSHFSFTEIKRRLKNAIGKEKNELSKNGIAYERAYERQNSGKSEKGFGGEKGGWNSPNRNHFYIEKFARPANGIRNKETIFKPRNSGTTMGNESVENNEKKISNIYIEAKRHLSDILSQGDEIEDLSNRPLPKALGKMISLPGYIFSPLNSPRENEHRLITAKQRLTSLSSFHIVNDNNTKLAPENDSELCENNSDVLNGLNHTTVEGETLSSVRSEKNSADDVGIVQATDLMNRMEMAQKTDGLLMEESKASDVPIEEGCSPAVGDNQVDELVEACDKEEKLECLEQEQPLYSPLTSPPIFSISKHIGDADTANERLERPSPVSVLEPLFIEDDISPAGIKFQPVEPWMRPMKIQFEEQLSSVTNQELYASVCLDDEESAFEYVEAVLLASDLNINEFRQRWLSSSPILDPSLFGEVELFSSRSSQDQKLLFDCTNEVLNEVFGGYFGYFPRVSFVRYNVRSIPRGMDLIHEIWNGVEWHLLEEHTPHTLDRIVRKDLKKDGKWMDLRFDVERIGFEVGDSIFDELVEDILSIFLNKDHEVGSSMISGTCRFQDQSQFLPIESGDGTNLESRLKGTTLVEIGYGQSDSRT